MYIEKPSTSPSRYIASCYDQIFNLDIRSFSDADLYQKLSRSVAQLNDGEVLRVLCDRNPVTQICGLAKKYGSKIIFQYLKNYRGLVIIDFKKFDWNSASS